MLFTVLPWGVRRHEVTGEGHDAGAPARPRLVLKMAVTTGITFVIWFGVYLVDRYDLIKLSEL